MKNIEKPTKEDITDAIKSIVAGDLTTWMNIVLPLTAKHLKINPIQYRNYGPYWWVIKKAMLDAGFAPFGQDIDIEMFEAMTDSDTAFSVFRAMLYYDYSTENDFIGRATHTIVDNGEDVEYTLFDNDAERYIAASGIK
jgi:hypothetical protein